MGIKVGSVQINNSFSGQNYFPYSVGLLQAYAQRHLKNIDQYEFLLPVYSRIKIEHAVEQLKEADIVLFSAYVWNVRLSLKIAEILKTNKPETIIVFGGPHVPDNGEEFLRQNTFVDIACHKEGEKIICPLLDNCAENKHTVESLWGQEEEVFSFFLLLQINTNKFEMLYLKLKSGFPSKSTIRDRKLFFSMGTESVLTSLTI